MNDTVIIPQSDMPAPVAAPVTADLPPEIAYLKQHGLEADAGSLHAELESLLKSAPAPEVAQPAPQAPMAPPIPVRTDSTPQAPTPQEKALDPYAPDGAVDEASDESVVIGADGRARDAVTGKFVPILALHKERDQHKQTRAELQQTRELNARVEERLAILNEILASDDSKAADAAPVAPAGDGRPTLDNPVDPEVDIFAWAKQQQDFARKQADYIKSLEDKIAGTERMSRQQIEAMQADQAIRTDVTNFYAKNRDFIDAYNHLRSTRDRALEVLGFADKAARDAQIAREERALASEALKNKRSYAETLYNLSKSYGYAGKQEAAPVAQAPAPAAPAAPQQPSVDPAAAAKIKALQAAKEAAAPTLNGAGGSAAEGLTVSQLANMSDQDFLNLSAKLGKAKLDALLRGT